MQLSKLLTRCLNIFLFLCVLTFASPVHAYTLENNLNFPFKPNFQQEIQNVEAKHGLNFHIKTDSYTKSFMSTGHEGAEAADKIQANLISTGNYDPEKSVIIVWLRQTENLSKGSFAVNPGEIVKSALNTTDTNKSELISISVKPFMPGDPAKAIITLASNLDSKIVDAQNAAKAGAAILIFVVGIVLVTSLFAFAIWISGLVSEAQATNKSIKATVSDYEDKLKDWEAKYAEFSREEPSIIFDLKMTKMGGVANDAAIEYNQTILAYGDNLIEARKELNKIIAKTNKELFSVYSEDVLKLLKDKLAGFTKSELALAAKFTSFVNKLETQYGEWLKVRTDKDYLLSKINSIAKQISFSIDGSEHKINVNNLSQIETLQDITNAVPLSLEDYKSFVSTFDAANKMSESLSKNLNELTAFVNSTSDVFYAKPKQLNFTQSPSADEVQSYSKLELLLSKNLEKYSKKRESNKLLVKSALVNSNLDLTDKLIAELDLWAVANIANVVKEMNHICNQCSTRYETAASVARLLAKQAEDEQRRKAQAQSRKSSSNSTSGSFYTEDPWSSYSSSSSSSSSYSSSDSTSSYSSDSSDSSYSSDSFDSDY